jgi:hypothetical protein
VNSLYEVLLRLINTVGGMSTFMSLYFVLQTSLFCSVVQGPVKYEIASIVRVITVSPPKQILQNCVM